MCVCVYACVRATTFSIPMMRCARVLYLSAFLSVKLPLLSFFAAWRRFFCWRFSSVCVSPRRINFLVSDRQIAASFRRYTDTPSPVGKKQKRVFSPTTKPTQARHVRQTTRGRAVRARTREGSKSTSSFSRHTKSFETSGTVGCCVFFCLFLFFRACPALSRSGETKLGTRLTLGGARTRRGVSAEYCLFKKKLSVFFTRAAALVFFCRSRSVDNDPPTFIIFLGASHLDSTRVRVAAKKNPNKLGTPLEV